MRILRKIADFVVLVMHMALVLVVGFVWVTLAVFHTNSTRA